ncbi:MAG: transposase [Terrimicrobiaceae bacterium]
MGHEGARAKTPYPRAFEEFLEWFLTEEDCAKYLEWARWPDGFVCPGCGGGTAWRADRGLWHCKDCCRSSQRRLQRGILRPVVCDRCAEQARTPRPRRSHRSTASPMRGKGIPTTSIRIRCAVMRVSSASTAVPRGPHAHQTSGCACAPR